MINLLKNILKNNNSFENKNYNNDLEILCGLMIEAAYTDGQIDVSELEKIKSSLINIFHEDTDEVDNVLKEAIENKSSRPVITLALPSMLVREIQYNERDNVENILNKSLFES